MSDDEFDLGPCVAIQIFEHLSGYCLEAEESCAKEECPKLSRNVVQFSFVTEYEMTEQPEGTNDTYVSEGDIVTHFHCCDEHLNECINLGRSAWIASRDGEEG